VHRTPYLALFGSAAPRSGMSGLERALKKLGDMAGGGVKQLAELLGNEKRLIN